MIFNKKEQGSRRIVARDFCKDPYYMLRFIRTVTLPITSSIRSPIRPALAILDRSIGQLLSLPLTIYTTTSLPAVQYPELYTGFSPAAAGERPELEVDVASFSGFFPREYLML